MSKKTVYLPEKWGLYNKETKEMYIVSIKNKYGNKVLVLPYIAKLLKPKQR